MLDYSVNASAKSPATSNRGSASPTLIDSPLEEFPPAQPTIFTPTPGIPRQLTPAPHASVFINENSATVNQLIALGRLSPQSIHSTITSHNLDPSTYCSIINGLVVTLEAHSHHFDQQFATQEEAHKKKLDDLDKTVKFLKACLVRYIDTFSSPLCKIYVTPKYTADPTEPLPHWVHETLQGPATGYAVFLDVVKSTDDWGLQANTMWYRDLDKHVIHYKAQLNCIHSKLTLWAFYNIIQFSCSQLTNQIAVFSRLNWFIL